MNPHVRELYLEWRERGPEIRARVDRHLRECGRCRRYFREMDRFLEPRLLSGAAELEPDPFLPERIAALSGLRKRSEAIAGSVGYRPFAQGIAFAAAALIGIFAGSLVQDASATGAGDVEEIVTLCRDAVMQADEGIMLEAVLGDPDGGVR